MGKGPGDVHDNGTTCFDVNEFVVVGTMGLCQLGEHFISEVVEKNLGGLVKFGTNRNSMILVQLSEASYSKWIFSSRD